ncbi:hypothetical protein [Nocardioides convexus]|uniref:hypothetical protein n=1 Tax=Nocardioides convexus TaxID=2712224 RepID=UPI0024186185|nr:hypothetical protein [Nocardioides convexus]
MDLRTLKHRNFTVSLVLMSAGFMAFLGSMILLPLYLQDLRGLSEPADRSARHARWSGDGSARPAGRQGSTTGSAPVRS